MGPNEDCDVSIKFIIDLHFVFVMKFLFFLGKNVFLENTLPLMRVKLA